MSIENGPATYAPEKTKKSPEKIKIAFVDTSSSVEDEARDVADAKMTASKEETKGFKGFFKRVWKHNLFHEYYRQKEIIKAREKIVKSGNLYANETDDKSFDARAKEAVVEKFTLECEELIHEEAGEKKEKLGDSDLEKTIKDDIKKTIREYAVGSLNEETFTEERNRILSRVKGARPDVIEKGSAFADNLCEVAKQVKQAIEHGQKLEELDLDFEVIIGKAKSGARTEAQFNAVDRITEKITKISRGLVNEATVATAVSIAYTLGAKVGQRILGSRLFAYGTFGATAVMAGGIAAARESKRLEEERRQHFREMAQGKKFDADKSPRRKEMEEFRYQTRDAGAMIDELESGLYTYDKQGKRENRKLDQEEFESVLACLADAEARTKLSDRQKIDLISFSDTKKIEEERMKLDLMRAKSKVDLRKLVEQGTVRIPGGKTIDEYLNTLSETRMQEFIKGDAGLEKKNELFKKMKHKQVWKAGLKGFATGAVIGLAAQEIGAFFNKNQEGLIENLLNKPANAQELNAASGTAHYTLAEHARRWIMGDFPKMDASNMHGLIVGGNHINLPEGADLVRNTDGTYDLVRGEEVFGQHLKFNTDGTLTEEAKNALANNGVLIKSSEVLAGPKEILKMHENLTTKVHRTLWYDNDTPKPVFDKNELKLWWGGNHGTGIDAEGNYVLNMKHMMPDGSYHGKFSVDAQEAMQSGKMKMMFSLSQDTQNQVIEVPIDAHGNAIIDPSSETGKLLFGMDGNGHAIFKGRYAEVAEILSSKEGVDQTRILATHEGMGLATGNVPQTVFDVPGKYEVDAPWVIPVVGRRPLEPTIHGPSPDEPEHVPGGYNNERGELKKHYNEILTYRNSNKQIEDLIDKIANNKNLSKNYSHFIDRLNDLRNFDQLTKKKRDIFQNELKRYNLRYRRNETMETFIQREIFESYKQAENICIEEAKIGERPFSNEFYEKSPLVKGIKDAEEIVIILDDPIGDAIIHVPIVTAIDRYLKQNRIVDKKIKIVTAQTKILKTLEDQFNNAEIINSKDTKNYFEKNKNKNRFIINANKMFEDYDVFGIAEDSIKDQSKVMSVDWASWMLETVPTEKNRTKKYDPIPSRILRNFEVMFGQKLFSDINAMDHFIERDKNFDSISQELRKKYNIKQDEKVIVIASGAGVAPKEYSPQRWEETLNMICSKYPKAHILFLDSPGSSRREQYGEMVDKLSADKKYNISRVNEDLSKMNTIMSMAEFSITPDTGLGHLCGAVGKPNMMLILGDPVQWSTAKTIRVMHKVSHESYGVRRGTYYKAWGSPDDLYVEDNGKMVGTSDIEPAEIMKHVEKILEAK